MVKTRNYLLLKNSEISGYINDKACHSVNLQDSKEFGLDINIYKNNYT
jgi:hypothetical protein